MTTHPAFENAFISGDYQTLLSLYTTALAQRDRAEAILRALLNPATSTQTIKSVTNEDPNTIQPDSDYSHLDRHSQPVRNSARTRPVAEKRNSKSPPAKPIKSTKSTVKPNLADCI